MYLADFSSLYQHHHAQWSAWQLAVNDTRLRDFTKALSLQQQKMDESRAVLISEQMPPSPGTFHYRRLQMKAIKHRQQIHGARQSEPRYLGCCFVSLPETGTTEFCTDESESI